MSLKTEIARRRTFAIISHPDAGKTTLTEKFLLYGGAVQLAGSVTAKKKQRETSSDWMELEKKRGISISSTVIQFEYRGYAVNLLDTPGHRDFSEDTYRVLTAVDAVIMVIDAGKGIESQTRKLFEICRRRGIPIFTLMNKLDRPAKDPLMLLDELESVLGINAYAVTWPLGSGNDFRGVYDRLSQKVHLFERTPGGAYKAPVSVMSINDLVGQESLAPEIFKKVHDELTLLEAAGAEFDQQAVLSGALTPVFFGSAANNFGVQLLLDAFLDYAAVPKGRQARCGFVSAEHDKFSGFIFKIQANMDPKHRDRLAFVRVCSGRFRRDMPVFNARTGKKLRLSSSHKLFGKDRETLNEAFPGDIVGIVGHTDLRIGDTLTEDPAIVYDEIPRFAPECFAYLRSDHTAQYKRFWQGLEQLLQEGVIQPLYPNNAPHQSQLLAAVGPLQFDVVRYRLEAEYGAVTQLEPANFFAIRWLPEAYQEDRSIKIPSGSALVKDIDGRTAVLFPGEWAERFFSTENPDVVLLKEPPAGRSVQSL